MTAFRLLVTPPAPGAWNMAADEALFLGRLRGESPPTLRFFAWDPPAVSLGYGQRLDGRIDLAAARALGVDVVRRLTGGSAILHEDASLELTYSVVAAAGDFAGAEGLLDTYRWIGAALASGLRGLGAAVDMVAVQPSDPATMPAFCFARTGSFEIEARGRKIVGSAQRRRGTAFLQHGSVMLAADPARLSAVFPGEPDPFAGMTTLEAAVGRRPSFRETADALARGFRRAHGLVLERGDLSSAEREHADALARDKYGTEPWTRRGRATPPVAAAGAG
jgi:lipoyl(octanoyl) transferase